MNDLEHALFDFCERYELSVDKPKKTRVRVDYIISADNGTGIGVIIKNWGRAVGVDIVIRAERMMKASHKIKGMIVIPIITLILRNH